MPIRSLASYPTWTPSSPHGTARPSPCEAHRVPMSSKIELLRVSKKFDHLKRSKVELVDQIRVEIYMPC